MEIEIFTLCDFAQDNNSKLTIVGTFDSIRASKFPCVHASCSVAVRLRFSPKETGVRHFKLRLIDSTGKEMIQPAEGNITIHEADREGKATSINVVASFAQLRFEKPGRYSFELHLDDEWQSGLPLYLSTT